MFVFYLLYMRVQQIYYTDLTNEIISHVEMYKILVLAFQVFVGFKRIFQRLTQVEHRQSVRRCSECFECESK